MNTVTVPSDSTSPATQFRHQFHPSRTLAAFGLLGLAGIVAHRHGIDLWTLAIGVVGPDLAFLAAIGAPNPGDGTLPRRAIRPYNLMHHPAAPLTLFAVGLALGMPLATVVGLAWLSHQAWDRGLGYNLRNADGTIRP